jgi:hypothetical protein
MISMPERDQFNQVFKKERETCFDKDILRILRLKTDEGGSKEQSG